MAKKKAEKGEELIQAHISDFAHGLRVYDKVKMVRIKSSEYSLLIMADHFPIVGQVDGTVELVTEESLESLGSIKGFFMHRNNEFSLLIEQQKEEVGNEQ